MSPAPRNHPVQPRLPDLMARLLSQRMADRADGFGEAPVQEVELHDAAPAPPCDSRTAWAEAGLALRLLVANGETQRPMPEWASAVSGLDSVAALPMAAGHFPQLVREIVPLMKTSRKRDLLRAAKTTDASRIAHVVEPSIRKGQPAATLAAIGLLRLSGDVERAGRLLRDVSVGEAWRDAIRNEEAALAWCAGRYEEAAALWASLPSSAPVLFNRGMAALFLDRPAEAKAALTQAANLLPEDGSWQHLARLYLALCEM